MGRILTLLLISIIGMLDCSFSFAALQLTAEEQAWLKQNKMIRISGPQAFPPFQYFDQDGTFKGMGSDYVFHIAKMVGLEVQVAEKQPWPEILKKIKNREIDLLTCAAITEERSNFLLFTKPHFSFPLIIISRKDAPFIVGLQSLHGKKIAITKKISTVEWLKRDKINTVPYYVNSPLDALKAVSSGQADVAIENLAAATYLIEKYGLVNLKVAAPTSYENYNLSVAVRKDWPELASIFDKGLASLSAQKHNEIRQQVIAVRYEHGLEVKDIVKWVLLVAGVAFVVLAGFILWNRKLALEIKERIKVESEKEKLIKELTLAIDEIRTLRGILPICSECKKIRDDKGYWTQIETYIGEHSEADFSHSICPHCVENLYGDEDWFKESHEL